MSETISGYVWENAGLNSSHNYLLSELKRILSSAVDLQNSCLFELVRCNGTRANEIAIARKP